MSLAPTPQARRGPGMHLTLRQLMIVVLYAALVLGVVATVVPKGRVSVRSDLAFGLALFLCLSLPVLSLLIRLLDRPGPMRSWLSALLIAVFIPGVALVADAGHVGNYLVHGTRPTPSLFGWGGLAVINVYLLYFLLFDLRSFRPRRCPTCGHRSQIPRAMGRRHDPAAPRVCVSCGAESGVPEIAPTLADTAPSAPRRPDLPTAPTS